jgi:hypothetical protein
LDSGHSHPIRWSWETGLLRLAIRYLRMVSALPFLPSCMAFPSQSISNCPKKNTRKEGSRSPERGRWAGVSSPSVSRTILRTASGAAPRAEKAQATDPSRRRKTSTSGSLSR